MSKIVVKPSNPSKTNLDVIKIDFELLKCPKSEDEKEGETRRKSFKITKFSNRQKIFQIKELSHSENYQVRGVYEHSLGLVGPFGEHFQQNGVVVR